MKFKIIVISMLIGGFTVGSMSAAAGGYSVEFKISHSSSASLLERSISNVKSIQIHVSKAFDRKISYDYHRFSLKDKIASYAGHSSGNDCSIAREKLKSFKDVAKDTADKLRKELALIKKEARRRLNLLDYKIDKEILENILSINVKYYRHQEQNLDRRASIGRSISAVENLLTHHKGYRGSSCGGSCVEGFPGLVRDRMRRVEAVVYEIDLPFRIFTYYSDGFVKSEIEV
jgi:hypothetical protein